MPKKSLKTLCLIRKNGCVNYSSNVSQVQFEMFKVYVEIGLKNAIKAFLKNVE